MAVTNIKGPKGDTGDTGPQGPAGYANFEEHVVTSQNVTDGGLLLFSTPSDPLKVSVTPAFGCTQRPELDYQIVSNRLIWTGLGMETIISEGDTLLVIF